MYQIKEKGMKTRNHGFSPFFFQKYMNMKKENI
jgi:hypothetical protein